MIDEPDIEKVDERTLKAAELRARLVAELEASGTIRSEEVRQAFLSVPRESFLPPTLELERVYTDDAIVVKTDEAGIATSSSSQPALMADMLEALDLGPSMRVLEIGAGVGYNAAMLGTIVGDPALVTSIDIDPEMVAIARRNLLTLGPEWERLHLMAADGGLGYLANAPYDRIIVTVQQWEIAPAWVAQLKVGGRLLLPLSVSRHIWNSLIPAFVKQPDGTLVAVDGSTGGFMLMRGQFQHPTTVMAMLTGDSPDPQDSLPLPAQLIPTFSDKLDANPVYYLNYSHNEAAAVLAERPTGFVFQPHGAWNLPMPKLPRVARDGGNWSRLNPEQRYFILQHQSFITFVTIALQDQLANALVRVELKENKAQAEEARPQYTLNSFGLALLEPRGDGSFDVAIILPNDYVVGLRLVAAKQSQSLPTSANQALARLEQLYGLWVKAGRLNVNQYRPIAYPASQLQPAPGFVVSRQYYNLLLPLPTL